MKITLAKAAGFCFGVQRATDTLEELINKNDGSIYTYGHIIHNPQYLESISRRGVETVGADDIDRIAALATPQHPVFVIIRAHGITKGEEESLKRAEAEHPGFHLVDCTCPFVSKVHRIADEKTDRDTVFILIGSREHPEVKGIMSWARGESYAFATESELDAFINGVNAKEWINRRVVAAAQTTQNITEWKKCCEKIKKLYTNAIIFDTICNVTDKRQREAERLAPESDVMIVIGGRESSNTKKLYDVCRRHCPRTYMIETANDIPSEIIGSTYKIGITAGASTPDGIIEEVIHKMAELENNKSFEELLDQSLKTLNTGDIVTGIVTSVTGTEVHLDVGAKATGIITLDQFTDDTTAKLADLVKVGDEVKAFVIKVSDIDGIATLSKKRVDSDACWFAMAELEANGTIVEGKVVEAVKGGVVMNVNSVRVFVPASLSGVPKDGDLNTLVGTTQKVKLKEVNARAKRAYGSIRDVVRAERKAREDAFWSTAEVGQKYHGTVKNLTVYGAFVEIAPGIEGMVHLSELSWKRVRQPSDVVSTGDEIDVYILDLNRERKRISLGCKTEETNPWYVFTHKYALGDTASVKVVNFTTFGAFAEIVPGQDGLIHISEISEQRIAKPSDVLELGQTVDVKIIAIDEEKQKVSLSIKALNAAPVEEAEYEEEEADDYGDGVVYSTDDPDSSVYADEE